jgi:predicted GIY-YIG superfamily endonuclease
MIENMILSRIYKISSPSTAFVYYGSTIKSLNERFSKHRSDYKRYLDGKINYITNFEIVKFNDCNIQLISECFYDTKKDLVRAEGIVIGENNDAINKRIAGRTEKEYYQQNKEKLIASQKEYNRRLMDAGADNSSGSSKINPESISAYVEYLIDLSP